MKQKQKKQKLSKELTATTAEKTVNYFVAYQKDKK